MKHEKEWYTCDRCGVEISDTDLHGYNRIFNTLKRVVQNNEYLEMISQSSYGYVSEKEHGLNDNMCVTIIRGYNQNRQSIHLCGKCRKEFERFLNNEH